MMTLALKLNDWPTATNTYNNNIKARRSNNGVVGRDTDWGGGIDLTTDIFGPSKHCNCLLSCNLALTGLKSLNC